MEYFLTAAGALCLVYYICLVRVAMDFRMIWLLAGVLLAGAGLCLGRFGYAWIPPWLLAALAAAVLCGVLLFAAVEGRIIREMFRPEPAGLAYLIVLGAHVMGTVPSRTLTRRLEKAGAYLRENPKTKAVLSGGKGSGEDITEALAMYRWLTDFGIEGSRLILEDRSTSTLENLRFSRNLLRGHTRDVGLVTNNFHIWRSLLLARQLGYENPRGISAPSDPRYQVHYLVREFFALIKEKIKKNI